MPAIINEGWDAKFVPDKVKNAVDKLPLVVQHQYKTTLLAMAATPGNMGDGMLHYMENWNHKRFSGQYCLLYNWRNRKDGKGKYLHVNGIGIKSGNGNKYEMLSPA